VISLYRSGVSNSAGTAGLHHRCGGQDGRSASANRRLELPHEISTWNNWMRLPSASRGIPASRLIAEAAVPSLGFPGPPAFRAPLRLVFESLFLIEGLFTFRKDEFLMAILANQCFVGHIFTSWSIWI